MKAEYLEPKDQPNTTTMFSNTQSPFLPRPPGFPAALMDCPNSEEDVDSRNSGGVSTPSQKRRALQQVPDIGRGGGGSASGDGATIEISRRPRGRPPGSKNKPKPPVIITRDAEPPMSPYILEVPGGLDVVEALSRFSRRRNVGLCVLNGSGTVANVTLRQPSPTPGATVTFHGRFDILSISATFIPSSPSGAANASPFASSSGGFTISLAGPQGQMIGGMVAGSLLAAGTVYVVAASFNSPSYHRLSAEDEGGSSASGCDGESPPGTRSGEDDGGQHAPGMEMSVYNVSGHVPSGDVIWAPTAARQQQPPY